MVRRLSRFIFVGGLNTAIDIAVITLLSWLYPTTNLTQLLAYNTLACAIAACNSFVCNKFWTFKERTPVTRKQVGRFALVAGGSMLFNNAVLSLFAFLLPSLAYGTALDTVTLKVAVAVTCMLISFVAMSLLVFVTGKDRPVVFPPAQLSNIFNRSISIILPAYNEGDNIAETVTRTISRMLSMARDFEVIVVNDGSKDNTRQVIEELTRYYPRHLRLINHCVNQGCGAALVTGFEAATKEYSFYMDSDGQFDIADMARLLPYVERYDGVFGYRVNRQDTWMRKLNAWGWNIIVRFFFRIPIRDVDCAFKIFRTEFFRTNKLEARGALLLTELIFKFHRAGYTFTQAPVRHFPRGGGKGTGAKPTVIARAFYELFVFASKWSQDDQAA